MERQPTGSRPSASRASSTASPVDGRRQTVHSALSTKTAYFRRSLTFQLDQLSNDPTIDATIAAVFNAVLKTCNDTIPPLCTANASVVDNLEAAGMYMKLIHKAVGSPFRAISHSTEVGRAAMLMVVIWAETVSSSATAFSLAGNMFQDRHLIDLARQFELRRIRVRGDEEPLRYLLGLKQVLWDRQGLGCDDSRPIHLLVGEKLKELRGENADATVNAAGSGPGVSAPTPPATPHANTPRPIPAQHEASATSAGASANPQVKVEPELPAPIANHIEAVAPTAEEEPAPEADANTAVSLNQEVVTTAVTTTPTAPHLYQSQSAPAATQSTTAEMGGGNSGSQPPTIAIPPPHTESEPTRKEIEAETVRRRGGRPKGSKALAVAADVPKLEGARIERFHWYCTLAKDSPFGTLLSSKAFFDHISVQASVSPNPPVKTFEVRDFFRDHWADFLAAVPQVWPYKPQTKNKSSRASTGKEGAPASATPSASTSRRTGATTLLPPSSTSGKSTDAGSSSGKEISPPRADSTTAPQLGLQAYCSSLGVTLGDVFSNFAQPLMEKKEVTLLRKTDGSLDLSELEAYCQRVLHQNLDKTLRIRAKWFAESKTAGPGAEVPQTSSSSASSGAVANGPEAGTAAQAAQPDHTTETASTTDHVATDVASRGEPTIAIAESQLDTVPTVQPEEANSSDPCLSTTANLPGLDGLRISSAIPIPTSTASDASNSSAPVLKRKPSTLLESSCTKKSGAAVVATPSTPARPLGGSPHSDSIGTSLGRTPILLRIPARTGQLSLPRGGDGSLTKLAQEIAPSSGRRGSKDTRGDWYHLADGIKVIRIDSRTLGEAWKPVYRGIDTLPFIGAYKSCNQLDFYPGPFAVEVAVAELLLCCKPLSKRVHRYVFYADLIFHPAALWSFRQLVDPTKQSEFVTDHKLVGSDFGRPLLVDLVNWIYYRGVKDGEPMSAVKALQDILDRICRSDKPDLKAGILGDDVVARAIGPRLLKLEDDLNLKGKDDGKGWRETVRKFWPTDQLVHFEICPDGIVE